MLELFSVWSLLEGSLYYQYLSHQNPVQDWLKGFGGIFPSSYWGSLFFPGRKIPFGFHS